MHPQYNVATLSMFINVCCINLMNVVTVLNVLLIIVVYPLINQ